MADVIALANEHDLSGEPRSAYKESAFTKILLQELEVAGAVESPIPCFVSVPVGRHAAKVNGYGLPEEDTRLDLVIADFRADEGIPRLQGADVERAFSACARFFEAALAGAIQADPGHEEHAMLQEIVARRSQFDRVQIVLITNGVVTQRKEKERRQLVGEYKISYEIWDLERLRRFRSSGATHEPVAIDLGSVEGGGIPCAGVDEPSLGYKTCVAIIPGELLYEWYDEFGQRLLELNVRSYLQAKGKVNKEILATLLTSPNLFLAYNNGITIVAEEMVLAADSARITAIHGLQIVNGGQTTASIHKARKESKADLSQVFVQAKITVVPAERFEVMVPEIARLSNSQNKVSIVDLGANHAFHVGVERVSKKTWAPGEQSMWFYERARGSYQTERSRTGTIAKRARFDVMYPVSQRFGKEELAGYCNAWDGLPNIVSKGGQKNFERFMAALPKVEKGWEPGPDEFKTLVAKAILYKSAQRAVKRAGISAFGVHVANYGVAVLAERTARRIDLRQLWERQGVTPGLDQQISDWLPRIRELLLVSAGDRNPGEWFKSEACWRHVREQTSRWTVSEPLSSELTVVSDGYADTEVQSNIARCLAVDAGTWMSVQLWGSETGALKDWQIGIANTLSGYAARSWYRKPSEKQARHAVVMLTMYREAAGV